MKIVKIISLFMAVILFSLCLPSCALLEKPSDEEIRGVLEEMLPASKEATEIVYGAGVKIDESFKIDPEWTVSHYAPVARDYKYQSIDDIKLLIRSVFSEEYAEEMYEYAFVSNDDYMSRYGEKDGKLTMDVTKDPFAVATDIYIETAHVVSGSAYACVIKVEMSNDGGKTRYEENIRLVMEKDKWKFDGPTY